MRTSRNLTNLQISKLLHAVSAALTLSPGDNRFRIVAYDRAADAIEHATSELKDVWQEGKLHEISGIGSSIAQSLDELFQTGKVKHFETLLKPFPPAVFELMEVPGLGPKNAYKLCKALGISTAHSAIAKLEKAARAGHVAQIEGFGEDSQSKLLQNVDAYKNRSHRLLLHQAHAIVDALLPYMQKMTEVKEINYLGSLRRQAATIGDIDLAIATDHPKQVLEHFSKYPKAKRVLELGEHSCSIVLPGEIQVDAMVQPPRSYGSLLQHFTGSKHHNIALREYALKQELSLSEYGIKKGDQIIECATEVEFYNYLGFDWVPPELREGRGELDAAKKHTLPQLVETSDIKGDLHIHSDFDVETSHDRGTSSVEELCAAAKKRGYEYIGLTEHNPAVSGHSKSQIIELIRKKIEHVNAHARDVRVFHGLEVDIQPNGELAVPDEGLELLDYACVSIHSSFNQDKHTATARVLAALSHPKVKFLAHPTGRLLNEREGLDYDWDQLFTFCIQNHKWLEIDGWPNRLDLPDVLVHEAVKRGVKIVVDTDSHAADSLSYMPYGVSVARRGWATPASIVNTASLGEFIDLLRS